ncbi:hypothetical protein FA95DRAFT_1552206, partial [Auriscalpium vulgare]
MLVTGVCILRATNLIACAGRATGRHMYVAVTGLWRWDGQRAGGPAAPEQGTSGSTMPSGGRRRSVPAMCASAPDILTVYGPLPSLLSLPTQKPPAGPAARAHPASTGPHCYSLGVFIYHCTTSGARTELRCYHPHRPRPQRRRDVHARMPPV